VKREIPFIKPTKDHFDRMSELLILDKPVEVYRNLNKDCFSVRQGGIVRFYTNSIILKNADFVVREKGRQKVLTEKRKNVHAFIKGYVIPAVETMFESNGQILMDWPWSAVSYNPYIIDSFFTVDDKDPVKFAKFVDIGFDDFDPEKTNILAFCA